MLVPADKLSEALSVIQSAIQLDATAASNYRILASIYVNKQQWKQVIVATDECLRLDPRNIDCLNLRALAQRSMGQRKEAAATIMGALHSSPESPTTHANMGWAQLERGQPRQAMEYFREALRINPQFSWAQQGIVEAMKARNPIYRVILVYLLWMLRFDTRTRILIVVGAVLGAQIARATAENNPTLEPYLLGLLIAYGVFVFLTWTAYPLFNLILRLDRFGRLALPAQEVMVSNWIGLTLILAAILFLAGLPFDSSTRVPLHTAALKTAVMILPIAGYFHTDSERTRSVLGYYVLGLIGLAILGLVTQLSSGGNDWNFLFLIAFVGFTWVATGMEASDQLSR